MLEALFDECLSELNTANEIAGIYIQTKKEKELDMFDFIFAEPLGLLSYLNSNNRKEKTHG